MGTRRLSTARRRDQLLAIGAELFAEQGYDGVWIEEVARIAGISRGLLYHYFPGKREFFQEVVRRESEQLLGASAPDPRLTALDQVAAGVDVYLGYAEAHSRGYRLVHRAADGADPEIRAIRDASFETQRDRILAGLAAFMPVDAGTAFVVRGWLTFVVGLVLDWLDDPVIGRDALRALCVRTLFAAVELDPAAVAGKTG